MFCPRCGRNIPASSGRCAACGAAVGRDLTMTGVLDVDTTGLPFGATRGTLETGATAGATIGAAGGATGPLTVGQSLGPRYHIIKVLGVGGMGAVYQAWDAELGVAVALKVIRGDSRQAPSSEAEKRFKQELLLARQVTHKNVVRIHDLGEIDGIKYITMPYVQGHDLATVLRSGGKLSVRQAMPLLREIAAGLQAAHDAGVVHRDLKPANIMVAGGGDDLHALIMDFGISASADALSSDTVVGTLEYMAPEQARGIADARADVYAFGLIAYEMLTGPRTRESASPQTRVEAMQKRFAEGLQSLRALDPSIPEPLESFVMKCLASDAAARYVDAAGVNVALAGIDDDGRRVRVAARVTKRLSLAALATLLVFVALAFYAAKRLATPVKPHDPVTVMIADFQNGAGDAMLGNTLRETTRRALEGASFISAYDRTNARSRLGAAPPDKLDAASARQFALKQGLGVVVAGSIEPKNGGFEISATASETVTGKVLATVSGRAAGKDDILAASTKLMAKVRKALGDRTSESAQLFAMRSLSASSLDVVNYYAAAVEAQSKGRFEEAQQAYLKAVQLDPKFGLGYQGLATTSRNLRRPADADKYIKDALRYLDGMSERERLGTRGYYDRLVGDNQQCVVEYGELLARYPADVTARNQRAACLSKLRKLREAVDELQYSVRLLPNYVPLRINLALLKNLKGDFQGAEEDFKSIPNPDANALQMLAYSQTGRGLLNDATRTYEKIRGVSAKGASSAAAGLGDLAVYEGRFGDAVAILREGAAADVAAGNSEAAAVKLTAVASAELQRGDTQAAIAAADDALTKGKSMAVRFLAARIFADAGAVEKARPLADALASELPAEPQAHGKILLGMIALNSGRTREGIDFLIAANGLLDTWFGHFELGRAYLAYGALPQADAELDLCVSRRGEALSLMDEGPTYGYFPRVYYYRGRVREKLNTAAFADSYREYLKIRGASAEDPLVADVRKRV
jgi:eukaryotic-like serine/threonine-protein kinase